MSSSDLHLQYYGLRSVPFAQDHPESLFMSESHQEALAGLRYGILDRKGIMLLTGEPGTGKSAVLEHLASTLAEKVHVCSLVGPLPSLADFYRELAAGYGFALEPGGKIQFLLRFARFRQSCQRGRERILLIVDHAHLLPAELLDEIRLLGNQDQPGPGVFSMVLAGQPSLADLLEEEQLLPLKQRLGLRSSLGPFSSDETGSYLRFRLRQAGGVRLDLFSREAVVLIHQATRGIPRLINMVGEQALFAGYRRRLPQVNEELVAGCLNTMGEAAGINFPTRPLARFSLKRLMASSALVKSRWRGRFPQFPTGF